MLRPCLPSSPALSSRFLQLALLQLDTSASALPGFALSVPINPTPVPWFVLCPAWKPSCEAFEVPLMLPP